MDLEVWDYFERRNRLRRIILKGETTIDGTRGRSCKPTIFVS